MGSNQVKIDLTVNTAKIKAGLAEADKVVNASAARWQKAFKGAGVALTGLSVGLGALTASFLEAQGRFEDLSLSMAGAFDNVEQLERMTTAAKELASGTQVTAEQFGDAAVVLERFGMATKANLQLVGDFAAKVGIDAPQAAQLFAEAELGKERALKKLEIQFGITKDELDEFGGSFQKFVQANYAGALDRTRDAGKELQDQLELLKGEIGEGVEQTFVGPLEEQALGLVKAIRGLSPEMKGLIGVATSVTSGIAGIAGPTLLAAANLKTLAPSFSLVGGAAKAAGIASSGFRIALTAALSPLGLAIGVVAAVALAFHSYTKSIEKNTATKEAFLAIQDKVLQSTEKAARLFGQSSEALKAQGVSVKEVTQAMLRAEQFLEQAQKTGNKQAEARWANEVARLKRLRVELREDEAVVVRTNQAKAKVEKQAAKDAAEAWENYKRRVSAGFYETKVEQLNAMDAIRGRLAQDSKERQELELNRVALVREAAKEEAAADEKARKDATEARERSDKKADEGRKEQLAKALHSIDVEVASRKMSEEQQVQALRRVLETHKLTADERRSIEQKLAAVEGKLADEKAQKAKEAEEAKRKAAEDAQKEAIERAKEEVERQKAASDEKRALDMEGLQLKRDAAKTDKDRLQAELEILRVETDARKASASSAEAAAQIEVNAVQKAKQMIDAYTDSLRKNREEKDKGRETFTAGAVNKFNESTFGKSAFGENPASGGGPVPSFGPSATDGPNPGQGAGAQMGAFTAKLAEALNAQTPYLKQIAQNTSGGKSIGKEAFYDAG